MILHKNSQAAKEFVLYAIDIYNMYSRNALAQVQGTG